jgi:hypothetical protein
MAEMLLMTRSMTGDTSKGLMACVDRMITLKAPKASPPSQMLEGDTTLETFLLNQIQWLATWAAASTHLFFVSKSGSCGREAVAGICWHLLIKAHISSATGIQQRLRGIICSGLGGSLCLGGHHIFAVLIVISRICSRDPRIRLANASR